MLNLNAALFSALVLVSAAPAFADQLCIQHSRVSPSSGFHLSPMVCADDFRESYVLGIGDDTGWQNQQLSFTYNGPGDVCFRHSAVGSGGAHTTPWACSSNGQLSPFVWMGDDTGYTDQRLQIRSTSPVPVCFQFNAVGSAGFYNTGWVCSSHGVESHAAWIGDDTGYQGQSLKVRVGNPRP